MPFEKYIMLFLPLAFSILLVRTSSRQVDLLPGDSENFLVDPTVFPEDEHPNVVEWKYKSFCMSENASNICMEVGMPSNGSLYPKKLRIRRFGMPSNGSLYPKKLRIRRSAAVLKESNDSSSSSDTIPIDMDFAAACRYPKGLKTAELRCKLWPSSITCKAYCTYGSTYKEGIVRTTSCKYKQQKWSAEFEECKPFVDCKLRLISPGSLKCIGNDVKKSPMCRVQCEIYEIHDAINATSYSCKSDGTWEPPLPFCVELKGTKLVPSPDIKEHEAIKYP